MIEWVGWDSDKCAGALGQRLELGEDFSPHSPDHLSSLGKMTVAELSEALAPVAESEKGELREATLFISLADRRRRPSDEPASVTFYFRFDAEGRLVGEVGILDPWMQVEAEAETAIGPLIRSYGVKILRTDYSEYQSSGNYMEFRFQYPNSWTIEKALALAELIGLIVGPDQIDPSSPAGAFSLLASGHHEGLIGQAESSFLEAKEKGYGFQNENQKHEYAMDLAALANTERGALLILGIKTAKNAAGQDVITGAPGCSVGSLSVETYTQVARQRIVPPITGVEFHLLEFSGRHFMAILIPSQPEYLKPFLVKGGITLEGRTNGASFTIPTRIGDSRWNMSAEAVHSLLVAARAALAKSEQLG
ncbi:hypothetical protein AB0B83_10950 [Micromonospora sp. NPDC049060]|uniref:AlbA family DNA-binding domain-containing protein n=1 Tax=Micromonospora sp. NPDC049060 TaxID=3154828 RepID=UPI0033FBAF42